MDREEITIKMQVTPAQGLALKAMFEHWNKLASWGCSRMVGFYVDGDGNFKPKAEVILPDGFPELTEEMREKSMHELIAGTVVIGSGDVMFDFDPIAWMLHD